MRVLREVVPPVELFSGEWMRGTCVGLEEEICGNLSHRNLVVLLTCWATDSWSMVAVSRGEVSADHSMSRRI